MKVSLKKSFRNSMVILALFLSLTIVPFCINAVFKIEAPHFLLVAEWGAGDILNFYGMTLSSIIAITAIIITILENQKATRRELTKSKLENDFVELKEVINTSLECLHPYRMLSILARDFRALDESMDSLAVQHYDMNQKIDELDIAMLKFDECKLDLRLFFIIKDKTNKLFLEACCLLDKVKCIKENEQAFDSTLYFDTLRAVKQKISDLYQDDYQKLLESIQNDLKEINELNKNKITQFK